jgi:hypothetical protein
LEKEYRFNIVLFVLDPDGKVVDAFLPFRETGGRMKGTQIVQPDRGCATGSPAR